MNRILMSVVCALFLLCVVARAESSQEPLTPAGSVSLEKVEGRLDHMAADVKSQRLFVAALENHSIEVIDLAKKMRIHRISGICEPQGLLFVPKFKRLLVCSRGDGTIRSFDSETFQEGLWIDLGRNADNVRLDAKMGVVYVGSGAEPGPGLLSAVDLVALLPLEQGGKAAEPKSKADLLKDRPRQADAKTEINLEGHPESFQVDADNSRIFVNVPDGHQVAVVNVKGNALSVSATWPVAAAEKNFPMALDSASGRLYVVCRKPAVILVFDTATGKLLSQTPCVGDSDDVFVDAVRRRLYVIGGEGFVEAYDTSKTAGVLTRLTRIPTAPKSRTGLFIPDLKLLAVAVPRLADKPATLLLYNINP
jgi:hypothetical protein